MHIFVQNFALNIYNLVLFVWDLGIILGPIKGPHRPLY